MKIMTKTALALTALGLSAWVLTAQDNGPGAGSRPGRQQGPDGQGQLGPGPGGPRRPPPPLMHALDANHDGEIDAAEIANASNALLTLDKNGDGKLTRDELTPPRPPRGNGPDALRDPPPPEVHLP